MATMLKRESYTFSGQIPAIHTCICNVDELHRCADTEFERSDSRDNEDTLFT